MQNGIHAYRNKYSTKLNELYTCLYSTKIKKQFKTIMLASSDDSWRTQEIEEVKMNFDTWKMWWDQSDNRKKWDGGLAMTHRNPPGVKDPYDYDKQTR